MMRENVMKEDKIHGKYCFFYNMVKRLTSFAVKLVRNVSRQNKRRKTIKIMKLNGHNLKKTFIQSKKVD